MPNIYDPTFVRKLFNQMSSSYERMNYITSLGFSFIWRKQFIHSIPPDNRNINVLDLLSGMGENWDFLTKRYPNATFSAIDFSEKMVEYSEVKNRTYYNNRFEIFKQDILNQQLPENQFDIVTCAFGLKTFNESQLTQIAQNLAKSLKKNGKIAFIEISVPPNKTLHFLYRFYLSRIIPVLGYLFLGNPSDYRLLWIYTENFKNCQKVKQIFEENGLSITYKSYFYGCASGFTGYKL